MKNMIKIIWNDPDINCHRLITNVKAGPITFDVWIKVYLDIFLKLNKTFNMWRNIDEDWHMKN